MRGIRDKGKEERGKREERRKNCEMQESKKSRERKE